MRQQDNSCDSGDRDGGGRHQHVPGKATGRRPAPARTPQMDVVRLLIWASRMHHSEIERRVAHLGVHHSQHRMLMYLAQCEEEPSQRQLAEAQGVSPAAITSMLKGLEREGYITRAVTDEDNRRHRITITDKGRDKVEETHASFDGVDRAMLADFTQEEMILLASFLRRMCVNLQGREDGLPAVPGGNDNSDGHANDKGSHGP